MSLVYVRRAPRVYGRIVITNVKPGRFIDFETTVRFSDVANDSHSPTTSFPYLRALISERRAECRWKDRRLILGSLGGFIAWISLYRYLHSCRDIMTQRLRRGSYFTGLRSRCV